jgi:hypothetical protein
MRISQAEKMESFKDVEKMAEGLWAAELTLDKSEEFKYLLATAIDSLNTFPPDLQRRTLQAAFTLYPGEFQNGLLSFATTTDDVKLFAIAINNILISNNDYSTFENLTKEKFAKKLDHPIIFSLLENIRMKVENNRVLPPISDLLNFAKDTAVFRMFMFVRQSRDYSGTIVFRKQNGEFLKDSSGKLVTLPYFARSITNMPGYLTNGNSPQGIFALNSAYYSAAKLIGPTPRIRIFMPSETDNATFYNSRQNLSSANGLELYKSLLPASWQNYFPIFESYYAGKAGRNDIVMHGTTVDQRYYLNEVYYPNVPTHGCLSGIERWNDEGYLIFSNQQRLLDIYASLGSPRGFLYLIELDDQKKNVTPVEIEKLLK